MRGSVMEKAASIDINKLVFFETLDGSNPITLGAVFPAPEGERRVR